MMDDLLKEIARLTDENIAARARIAELEAMQVPEGYPKHLQIKSVDEILTRLAKSAGAVHDNYGIAHVVIKRLWEEVQTYRAAPSADSGEVKP